MVEAVSAVEALSWTERITPVIWLSQREPTLFELRALAEAFKVPEELIQHKREELKSPDSLSEHLLGQGVRGKPIIVVDGATALQVAIALAWGNVFFLLHHAEPRGHVPPQVLAIFKAVRGHIHLFWKNVDRNQQRTQNTLASS